MNQPVEDPEALHTTVTEEYCDVRTNVPFCVPSKCSPVCTLTVTFAEPSRFIWNFFPVLPEIAGRVTSRALLPLSIK